MISKYEELRAGQWPTGVRKHVRAKKAAKGSKATLSSKQELFAIKNSMYRLKETEEREALVCPCPANPFNIQCRVCTAFAHDGICKHCLALTHMLMWQETIGGTSGTLSATSGSWLCDCRWERERALQLKLLRRLCPSPSPNLLMPGVTAQMNPNQHHEQESSSQAPVVQPLNIRSIQSLDHCMSFWHVLEWLQESFLTRGTIMYSWIAQKRSLGFLVKNASDTSKRQKIPLRGLQVPLWGHL